MGGDFFDFVQYWLTYPHPLHLELESARLWVVLGDAGGNEGRRLQTQKVSGARREVTIFLDKSRAIDIVGVLLELECCSAGKNG